MPKQLDPKPNSEAEIARVFHALGDPTRRTIVEMLSDEQYLINAANVLFTERRVVNFGRSGD